MQLVIRDIVSSDAADLARLVTSLGYPAEPEEMGPRLEKMVTANHRTLVACVEGNVAGFIGLVTLPVYEYARPIGWILALCVLPDQRRKGIAQALVAAAENHFRSQDAVDVRLHSGLQRGDAHRFYEKIGFDTSGYRFKKRLS